LFLLEKNRIRLTQIDDHGPPVITVNRAVHNGVDLLVELLKNHILFRFPYSLNDDLFGRLRSDATEFMGTEFLTVGGDGDVTRVKCIVKELQGEKIDIVRWSENILEYVKGALSPAQCSQVKVTNQDDKKIEVLVEDDQLALAIGRNGQNVRLASKLTGWSIDVKSKKQSASEKIGAQPEEVEKGKIGIKDVPEFAKLGARAIKALTKAEYRDVEAIAALSLEKLMELEGVGEKTAKKIRDAAKNAEGRLKKASIPPEAESKEKS